MRNHILIGLSAVVLAGCVTQPTTNAELCAALKSAPTLDDSMRYMKALSDKNMNCGYGGQGISNNDAARSLQMMKDYERATGKPFPQ